MFGGKSFTPETDIPDLSGKVILVTGGNTGLGLETILQLARHSPAHIYLAARSPSKGSAAVRTVQTAVPNAPITLLPLDLSSFASISAAARTFTSQSPRLDLLINNAGIMAVPASTTAEGYEIQFGTNHVGHALLTKLLLPTLLRTAAQPGADVRIINLSSEGHRMAPWGGVTTDPAKLAALGPWAAYGNSKLANILFSRALAERYPAITSVAVHPGVIKTDLYAPNSASNVLIRWGLALLGPWVMGSVQEGAKNQLWAATVPKGEVVSGAYYTPVGKSGGNAYARDGKMAERLWEWTERELGEKAGSAAVEGGEK